MVKFGQTFILTLSVGWKASNAFIVLSCGPVKCCKRKRCIFDISKRSWQIVTIFDAWLLNCLSWGDSEEAKCVQTRLF